MRLGERDDREPADEDQRRRGEERLGFEVGERLGLPEALAHFDVDDGDFGAGGIHAEDRAGADGGALVSGVVKDPFGSGLHLAQVLDGSGVGDAIPDSLAVAQEVVEGVDGGFGFEEEAGAHGVHGTRKCRG